MTSSKRKPYMQAVGIPGLLVLPFFVTDYIVSVVLDILTWIALTESWIILSGFTGYISLGHSAFFGIGACVMAISWVNLPYGLIILISAASSMALAFAIGFPVLRVRNPYFVILTLGLSEFAKYLFINYEVNVKGTVGRILLGLPSIKILYYSLLIILGFVLVVIVKYLPSGIREVVRTLAAKPRLLLLDEVLAGLTSTETAEAMKFIEKIREEMGLTIFIVEHMMKAVMGLSDRIIVLHNGEKIAEGKAEAIAGNPVVMEAYLGEKLRILG